MLILLPPSENKRAPRRGPRLSISDRPTALQEPTRHVLDALTRLCSDSPDDAARVLGLSAGQRDLLWLNAELATAPCAPAWRVYSGVLFDALDVGSMSPGAKRRALASVWVASALFGVVQLAESIPAHRLSAGTTLPGVPRLTSLWRQPVDRTLREHLGRDEMLLDLRSSSYVALWPIPPDLRERAVVAKVWQRRSDGSRSAVSHANKATKGRIAADLLRSRRSFTSPSQVSAALRQRDWDVELIPPVGTSAWRVDITID